MVVAGLLMGFVTIGEGYVGVQTEKGAVTGEVYEPGWTVQNPVTQSYEEIETRPVTINMEDEEDISVITEDGQDVFIEATVRYEVSDPVEMFSEYKNHDQAQHRLIEPTVRSEMRHEASNISARDIITRDGRTDLEDAALQSLRSESSGGIDIQSVQVRNVELNEEFSNELEQVEVENARAEQRVIEAEGEAEAERVRAEGDRDAMEIRNEELTPEILALEQIEAYDDGTVYVTDGDTPVIMDSESNNGNALEPENDTELVEEESSSNESNESGEN